MSSLSSVNVNNLRGGTTRDDVGSEGVQSDFSDRSGTRTLSRALAESVAPFGNDGECVARNTLPTLYSGSSLVTGTMFSVTAKEDIEILSFEFSNAASDDDLEVEIYTRPGNEYISVSGDRDQWTQLSRTVAQEASEGVGAVAPRADMTQSIRMVKGESRSFYFTLKTPNLQVDAPADLQTGQEYVSDDKLQMNVGVSLKNYPFPSSVERHRAFEGRIHYRSFLPCNEFPDESTFTLSFATNSSADFQDVNRAVTNSFLEATNSAAKFVSAAQIHGLKLDGVEGKNKGQRSDCSEYGFSGGCQLLDSTLTFTHFQTLKKNQVFLQVLSYVSHISKNEGSYIVDPDFSVKYTGDQVFRADYNLILSGVPEGTILNPIQRNYIEDVTYAFLQDYSDSEVYDFEVFGQVLERRRELLRGLQDSSGTVQVEASVFGVEEEAEDFLEDIEDAFLSSSQLAIQLKLEQYRPGEINEIDDFGTIFSSLRSVEATLANSNGTSIETVGGDKVKKGFTSERQMIMWCLIMGLSVVWLVYRIIVDFCIDSNSSRMKQQTMAEQKQRDAKEQALLDALAKEPPPKISRTNSFTTEKVVEPPKSTKVVADASTREPSRGVSKSNTFSGADAFFGTSSKTDTETKGRREPPKRGVGASKSFDGAASFFGAQKPAETAEKSVRRPPPSQRGVGASKSFDGAASFFGSKVTASDTSEKPARSRPPPASRGVTASRSFDGAASLFGPKVEPPKKTTSSEGLGSRRAPPQRGVGASKSFDGAGAFFSTGSSGGDLPARTRPTPGGASPVPPRRAPTASKSGDLPPRRPPAPSRSGDLPARRPPGASRSGDLPARRPPGPSRSGDLPARRPPGPSRSGDLPGAVGQAPGGKKKKGKGKKPRKAPDASGGSGKKVGGKKKGGPRKKKGGPSKRVDMTGRLAGE